MLDRDQVLKIIEDGYAARVRGDKAALARFWAAGAQFRIVGAEALAPQIPRAQGEAEPTVAELMDRVTFSGLERLDAVVEGHKAAVLWRVDASVDGKPPVKMELLDLIELDADGKVASLTQFGDTATMVRMLG
jgi:ketosteroid isomerase-like protein